MNKNKVNKTASGKATGGLVQHGISISGAEVPIIKIFANCSFCYIYKDYLLKVPANRNTQPLSATSKDNFQMKNIIKIKKVKLIFLSFLLIALLVIGFKIFGTNSDVVKGVNSEKIKIIKLGMKSEKVILILGKPFKSEKEILGEGFIYSYTNPVKYSIIYPMLWIHFDKKLKVREVYAKRYILFGADDECIYLLNSNNNYVEQKKFMFCFR
ncbi:hypothetical protein [Kaistella jeonii]|uniref:hypothetical protein n=1 Tax=Kaistella jeonii TaxID=266749 RepID=UPI000F84388C|nr:hypothetical protein [Kaistella jeonii]